MPESVSLIVARYAAETSFESLPDEVREQAKQVILDELASAAYGRARPAGELAARYVSRIGAPGPCRVLGTRMRTAAPLAALANGMAGHADEVDGAHIVGGHPGATIVHAATAAAQEKSVSGAELINAVVLGYDVGNRVAQACGGVFGAKSRLHLHVDFLHSLGAAAATARLLGLSAAMHCHTMALVTFQANGLCALFQEREHVSKSFCHGQYAFAGVSAALMAEAGFEGCEDVLAAPDGVMAAWGVEQGKQILTDGLGTNYAVMGANFKFINAGYPIHAAVEAAMSLVDEFALTPEQIDAVEVGMPSNALRVVDNRAMHNICLQDTLGAALVKGGIGLRHPAFPGILDDPAFDMMRSKITLAPDAELDRDQPNGRGAVVRITARDGASVVRRVDWPKGHSRRGRISWDDLAAKWAEALPHVDATQAVALACRLEELDDVGPLLEVFER